MCIRCLIVAITCLDICTFRIFSLYLYPNSKNMRIMKKTLLGLAMVALVGFSCTAGNRQQVKADAPETEETSVAVESQAAADDAPDFTLNDINGKPLALSSLRGKYVVLDFWGSWCIWCIRGIPAMKEYYQKYAGKFEILGIDCNDPEDKWKAAVAEHELPWLHVYNPKESNLLETYGIQGFPTKIIISPEGKIVKTVVGESPEFYTALDELFK